MTHRPFVQLGASVAIWLAASAAFWAFVAWQVEQQVARGVVPESVDDAVDVPALEFALGFGLLLLAANVALALGRWCWARRAARRAAA